MEHRSKVLKRREEFTQNVRDLMPKMQEEMKGIFEKYQKEMKQRILNGKEVFENGEEVTMEEELNGFTQDVQQSLDHLQKEIEDEISKEEGKDEMTFKEIKETIEEEKTKERFEKELFSEHIEKTKNAIQKIFDESGVIDFIEEQCQLLKNEDDALKQQHLPIYNLFVNSQEVLMGLYGQIMQILNEFIGQIDRVGVDYESEMKIERIESPQYPSLLFQNSELPSVLEDLK